MKKLLAFLLLIIYTCVSTGFAVSTHYCMDKQQSVELGAVKKELCKGCGMYNSENHSCCHNEVKEVKLQQDTQIVKLLMPSFELILPIAFVSLHLSSPFYNFTKSSVLAAFEPPLLYNNDIYIANRVFRI